MTALHDVAGLTVSAGEYPKVRYLLFAVNCLDEAHQDFKGWRDAVAWSEGVTTEARIDWRYVQNFCAPQVLLVMAHDRSGREFTDHPVYAVLMDTRQVLFLSSEVILSVKEDGTEESGTDVLGALNSLNTYVEAMTGGKKENAMRQLQILKRILR